MTPERAVCIWDARTLHVTAEMKADGRECQRLETSIDQLTNANRPPAHRPEGEPYVWERK